MNRFASTELTSIAEPADNNTGLVIRPLPAGNPLCDFRHPKHYIRCGEEAALAARPELKVLVHA